MASKGKSKRTVRTGSRSLSLSQHPMSMQVIKTSASGSTAAVGAPPDDPRGFKPYIAFSVAHGLFPQGDSIDPDQKIGANATANPDTMAVTINFYAQLLSAKLRYTWSLVGADDVKKLTTVQDLVDLVKEHLTDAGAASAAAGSPS